MPKFAKKNGDFTPFISKIFQMWDHFFPLLFPNYLEYLKIWDIHLLEVGAKRWYLKSEQTHKQTNRHTHPRTNRLIESIGPEPRCFEKLPSIQSFPPPNRCKFSKLTRPFRDAPELFPGRSHGHGTPFECPFLPSLYLQLRIIWNRNTELIDLL